MISVRLVCECVDCPLCGCSCALESAVLKRARRHPSLFHHSRDRCLNNRPQPVEAKTNADGSFVMVHATTEQHELAQLHFECD
jgi:hypothetical protein